LGLSNAFSAKDFREKLDDGLGSLEVYRCCTYICQMSASDEIKLEDGDGLLMVTDTTDYCGIT